MVTTNWDTVLFERSLLEKSLTKTLKLTNVCAIPINWSLKGVENLPEEFKVAKTSGSIKPCKEELVDISFSAKKEQKFLENIKLEVEDVEDYSIK